MKLKEFTEFLKNFGEQSKQNSSLSTGETDKFVGAYYLFYFGCLIFMYQTFGLAMMLLFIIGIFFMNLSFIIGNGK